MKWFWKMNTNHRHTLFLWLWIHPWVDQRASVNFTCYLLCPMSQHLCYSWKMFVTPSLSYTSALYTPHIPVINPQNSQGTQPYIISINTLFLPKNLSSNWDIQDHFCSTFQVVPLFPLFITSISFINSLVLSYELFLLKTKHEFVFFFFNLYWNLVHLQCYVSFRCLSKWLSYTYMCILFWILFHYW